jgi:ankyrin repeat protein
MIRRILTPFIVALKGRPSPALLETAIRKNDLPEIKGLLLKGADLTAPLPDGNLALHLAAKTGNIKILRFLLRRMNINAPNREGAPPLFTALECKESESIHYLIKKGCDLAVRDNKGFTALHKSAASGDIETTRLLVSKGLDVNDQSNPEKTSPLHEAVRSGNISLIDFLLEQGARINAENNEGTPFYWAACFGEMNVADHLLQKGADPTIPGKGGSPLILTATFGRDLIFEKILKKHPRQINDMDPRTGENPLHAAIRNGNYKFFSLLVSHGADIHARDKNGDMPIHLAAHQGNVDIAKSLILRGADVNRQNDEGATPLLLATKVNNPAMVKCLLQKGADPSIADRHGNTPAVHAGIHHLRKITELLNAYQTGNV